MKLIFLHTMLTNNSQQQRSNKQLLKFGAIARTFSLKQKNKTFIQETQQKQNKKTLRISDTKVDMF